MLQKPITLARHDYMQGIVDLTNKSGLPAFVIVDVLEHVLGELRPAVSSELKRDEAAYREALIKETQAKSEQSDNNEKE